jgi:proline iminopeptidase
VHRRAPTRRPTGATGWSPTWRRCAHLGLERFDLLGHSAAGDLAALYAAAHPGRLDHLILLAPGLQAVGVRVTEEEERDAMERRSAEPWYAGAAAAVQKAEAGQDSLENRSRYVPFYYGRWDEAARAHTQVGISERARAVREGWYAEGAFRPEATRAALRGLTAPVLIYAGELDFASTPGAAVRAADLFPSSKVVVQPGTAHYPWLDDPAWFRSAIDSFLG